MDKNNIPEEVTITPVIRDLERLFNRVLKLVANVFGAIFRGIRTFVLFSAKKFVPLFIILAIGMCAGYFSMQVFPRNYASNMVIKMNVDALAQLSADIQYFESLIQKEQTDKLSEVLQISKEEAISLTEIKVLPFSTYMEKVDLINSLYKNLDTATYKHLDFDKLLTDEDPTLSQKFVITVYSTDQKLFSKLEKPLTNFLERVSELQQLRLRQKKSLESKRVVYLKEMESLDTLKGVFNRALLERAKVASQGSSGTSINLGQKEESKGLDPLQIYTRYMEYASELTMLDDKISALNNCYEVYAHFSDFGSKSGLGKLKRAALGGIILLLLGYVFFGLQTTLSTSSGTND